MSADGTLCLGTPHEDLLRGQRVDSIHTHQQRNGDQATLGSATFSDLTVTQSGTYRFRINLVDMARSVLDV